MDGSLFSSVLDDTQTYFLWTKTSTYEHLPISLKQNVHNDNSYFFNYE